MMRSKSSLRQVVLLLLIAFHAVVIGLLLVSWRNRPGWYFSICYAVPVLLLLIILKFDSAFATACDWCWRWLAKFFPSTPEVQPWRPKHRHLTRALDSLHEDERRWAIQWFADLGESPVAQIRCWPEKHCTDLQLAAAEAMIREWLEYLADNPAAQEGELVQELFPLEEMPVEEDCVGPRVRRLAQPEAPPAPPPSRLEKQLDRWSETVKQTLLDWDVTAPSEDLGAEGDDCPLLPLDREEFGQRMRDKVAEVMQHVADTLAAARTDYELVSAEKSIHPMLSTLRWEAVVAALDLRQPQDGPVSIDEVRELADSLVRSDGPAKDQPRPTGDWVSRYRRMRAAGF